MKTLTDPEAFAQVEAALRAYALVRPPATLAPAVLARLRRLKAAERPRFRLTTFDLVLPLLGSLVMMGLWLAFNLHPANTPIPYWAQELAYLQLQVRWLWLYAQPFLPATPAGWFGVVVLCGTALTAVMMLTLNQAGSWRTRR